MTNISTQLQQQVQTAIETATPLYIRGGNSKGRLPNMTNNDISTQLQQQASVGCVLRTNILQ
jgi:hypothetical protein